MLVTKLAIVSVWVISALAAILGVDYGQQFTKSVLLAPGASFEIVLTDEGKRKDLSGISLRKVSPNLDEIERVYGSQIGSLCTRFPQSCVTGIKPLLGKAIFDAHAAEYLKLHFGIKLIEATDGAIRFDLGLANSSYEFSPEEILAMNLNEIKQRALSDLESNPQAQPLVEDIAVSIPPFLTASSKQAYLDAILLANFSNPLGLVEEGTAVALNYVSNRKFDKSDYKDVKNYHLVYDVGAGSTTATLFSYQVSLKGGVTVDIESVGYDEFLGGQLLTKSIYDIVYEKFLDSFGLPQDFELSPKHSARLLETAEKAKTILSANSEYHVSLESFHNDKDFKTTVFREEFEEWNGDLLARITKPILTALAQSPTGPKSISDLQSVILNGGSSRVPFIQKHLESLLGGDKIAKTVNADEACALGTTLRAFQWKTNSDQDSIKLVERSHHNYEVVFNGADEQLLAFAKGDIVGNTTTLNLGPVDKQNEVTVELYEDGSLYKGYKFEGISKKLELFTCKSSETSELVAKFSLDHNKVFELVDLNVECTSAKSGGFFKNLLNKDKDTEEEEVVEEDTKEQNTTVTKAKKLKTVRLPLPKATYPAVSPFSRSEKEKLFNKLAYLNAKDEERIVLDHVRNILEGQCYELRSYIEDNEATLLKEITQKDLDKYTTFVRDTIEWLDFESDDASIEQVRDKITELNGHKKEVDRIIDMDNIDLSFSGFENLYEQGTKIAMKIQSHMLDFGSEISEIRQKYAAENFDFDKENDRIKMQLISRGDEDKMMSLDRNLAIYKDHLTEVGNLVNNEKKFNRATKAELYDLYKALSDKIVRMLADIGLLETSHKTRVESFNSKFEKLIERRKQKEVRDQIKQAKQAQKEAEKAEKEAEKAQEEEAGIIEEDEENEPADIPVESVEEAEETEAPEVDHDEL